MRIRLFLFFMLCADISWSQTFKVDVRMIEVYATVSDSRGRAMTNLHSDDFHVLEDNRLQQIRVFEPQSSAMTIALLVDTTGSMAADLPRVKNAVARLLDAVKPEDNVGLFTFANGLNRLSNFSTDRKYYSQGYLQSTCGRTDSAVRFCRATIAADFQGWRQE